VPRLRLHPSLLRLVAAAVDDAVIQARYHPVMGQGEPARARMWETGGRWYAHVLDVSAFLEVTGTSRASCLDELRALTGGDVDLLVEVIPAVVGVAEAAEIMGWDKRRVITYIDRGSFPEPITTLASGRIWLREDVEDYAAHWRATHPPRSTTVPAPA
jgi:hypothetical protein